MLWMTDDYRTFAIGATNGALCVSLSVARTINAEVLAAHWLVGVTWTRLASLLVLAVKVT